jgi:tetratricopeptide (TPR) repeat protein
MNLVNQERLLRDAMRFNPTFAPTYNTLGREMLNVGRTDEGVALLRRSVQIDPLSAMMNGAAAAGYVNAGRRTDASEALERAEALWPDSGWDRLIKFEMASYLGTPRDMAAVEKLFPHRITNLHVRQADADLMIRAEMTGDKTLVARSIGACFDSFGKTLNGFWDQTCLLMMVRNGAMDDAFRFAARAFPDNRELYPPDDDRWIAAPPLSINSRALFLPKMARFRNDSRFWSLALRTGLVGYWRTTQQWPDFCRGQMEVCKARAAEVIRNTPAVRAPI